MAEIHIRRQHDLGIARARKTAMEWTGWVERDFQMTCEITEGRDSDRVTFERSGISGTLLVGPDIFELNAKLGFLLGAFSKTIESEIVKTLDQILATANANKVASKSALARKASSSPARPRSGENTGEFPMMAPSS
jgi:putative polyhydroxyalkanoate system protein